VRCHHDSAPNSRTPEEQIMELVILLLLGFSQGFGSQWSKEARYNAEIPYCPELARQSRETLRQKMKIGLDHEFGPN